MIRRRKLDEWAEVRLVASAGILSLVTAASVAEDVSQLAPGTRVLVEVSTAEEALVGKLLAVDDQKLNLQVEDEEEPRVVVREDITALAVSGGRRSRGKGALIRAGIGIVAGAAIGFAEDYGEDYPASVKAGILAYFFAPIGALIGLVIPPGERWEDVPLDNVRLSVGPVPGRGAGVFVTVGF